MKVMNVGNTSYSNSKQQNFGMRFSFAPKVIELLGGEQKYAALAAEVAPWRTGKGRDILVSGDGPIEGVMRFRAYCPDDGLSASTGLSGMKVDIARRDVDQTFVDDSFSDFLSRLKMNLAIINECFGLDLSKYGLK